MVERFRPASRIEADGIGEVMRAIVGPAHVRAASEAEAIGGILPFLVVEPADERQAASVLRCANQAGLAVVPCGGRTKLDWGNPPSAADLIVSLRRLNHVVEHAWADLTVTVEAGCTVAQLQRTLAGHGQRLAVDPLWPEQATIGGVLSTNDTGALRLAYGGLRDLIIGVTLVLADGTIASSGGKVVKNVAGYDLPKLATGSLGTLGMITRAVFRLHPLPHHARTLTIPVKDPADAQRLMLAILGARLAPASVQARFGAGSPPAVDVLLEGTEAGIAAQESALRDLARPAIVSEGSGSTWGARQALWPPTETSALAKFTVLPSQLARTAEWIDRSAKGSWSAVVQGTGIGHVRLDADLPGLRSALERDGGSLVILTKTKLDAWGGAGDALPLMRAVKEQFDPRGTLNPRRFVGGI